VDKRATFKAFLEVLQAAKETERRLKELQDNIFRQKLCRTLVKADFGRTYPRLPVALE
jgi:hypothetical protein